MIDWLLFLSFTSIALVIYVYAGYPLLLWTATRFYHRKHLQSQQFDKTVTLIVSCFNEHEVIRDKIENCLKIDYPPDFFEIIFVSDGSFDGTDEVIQEYDDPHIRLIRQEGRLGKTSGLNLALPQANGEIVVFSDANAMYQPDAIKKLVQNFASPEVGYVVGAAIYTDGEQSSAAKSENSYWEYELSIKRMESDLHSVVGGDGAIYAIRKALFIPLDAKDINDFVNPLQIVEQGYRGLFEPEAICLEETANNFKKEARRKERIVNRSFRGLMKVKSVLNPFRFPVFAVQVISHKLLRWLLPVFLCIIAATSVLLAYQEVTAFQILYILEMLFLWLAVVGYLKQNQTSISPVFFYPYYFLMVNYYSLVGVIKALSGKIQITWSSPRTDSAEQEVSATEKMVAGLLFVTPLIVMYGFL